MKTLLFCICLLMPFSARAAIYALTCATSCVVSDGSTQPSGTVVGLTIWDGASNYQPAGLNVVAYTGQALYTPTPLARTTIPVFNFFQRFTSTEFAALMANTTAAGIVAQLNAYGASQPINVTDPTIIGYMAQAVAAGLITSARSTQILNLSVSSP